MELEIIQHKASIEQFRKEEEMKTKKVRILEANLQNSQDELEAFQVSESLISTEVVINIIFFVSNRSKFKNLFTSHFTNLNLDFVIYLYTSNEF